MPRRAKRAKRDIARIVKRIDTATDLKDVAVSLQEKAEAKEKVKLEGRVPGRIIDGKKIAFTHNDLVERFGVVTFTPEETVTVNYQGVGYQLIAGLECHMPGCVQKVYEQRRRALREAHKGLPVGIIAELGAGALT